VFEVLVIHIDRRITLFLSFGGVKVVLSLISGCLSLGVDLSFILLHLDSGRNILFIAKTFFPPSHSALYLLVVFTLVLIFH
jgi:hypothetical protein